MRYTEGSMLLHRGGSHAWPSIRMVPAAGSTNRNNNEIKVLFPAPVRPTMPKGVESRVIALYGLSCLLLD